MLAVGNDIFSIRKHLFLIWYFASSSIVIDIQKKIQRERFLLLENIGVELLIFRWKFSIDLWWTISDRIFSHINFFYPWSFHNALKCTESFPDDRFREFDAKLFFHKNTIELNY